MSPLGVPKTAKTLRRLLHDTVPLTFFAQPECPARLLMLRNMVWLGKDTVNFVGDLHNICQRQVSPDRSLYEPDHDDIVLFGLVIVI